MRREWYEYGFKQYPLTKERLLSFAKSFKAMNNKEFVAFLGRNKLKGRFDSKKWNEYMTAMTGVSGCAICGGPRKQVGGHYRCIEHEHHFAAMRAMDLSKDFEYAKLLGENIDLRTGGLGPVRFAIAKGRTVGDVIDAIVDGGLK